MPDTKTWMAKLDQLAANPGDIQSLGLQQTVEVRDSSIDIAEPTNPFIQLMEASSVNTAAAIASYEALTRRQYGALSQTYDDLYVHMSDVDYLNRFAVPSGATFFLLLETEELLASMVDTGVNDIKQLIIPRFTAITVNETTFTLQYAIKLRQMAHGGLQIIYDGSQPSPIEALASNIVQWDAVTLSGPSGPIEFVRLWLPMRQFAIKSQTAKISYAGSLIQTYTYPDQFYYARAYSIATNGAVTEILTTHTAQTFDPTKPTLVLKDLGGALQVSLPQIYLTNRTVGGEIRVDIYTTKGELALGLGAYAPNSFGIDWNGATPAETPYVAPLTTFKTMTLYSQETTAGGANAMPFSALREQVLMNNFGPVVLPITPSQLSQSLTTLGYQPVIDVDNVTDRVVLATRMLPAPANGLTTAGAGMSIETLVTTFNALAQAATVMDNGERLTILPTTLFSLANGQLTMVPDTAVANLKALATDALVRTINAGNYMYTPLHYVLDSTDNLFALRPYYLDAPQVNSVQFVMMNESVGITVGRESVYTQDKELIRTETGYRLRVQCQSSDGWKALDDGDVFCQLAFIPANEKTYAYLNGTLIGTVNNERVFEFDLGTNYDVDEKDNLTLTTFQMYDDNERQHGVPLTDDFDLFWVARGVSDTQTPTTQIDLDLGKQLLPEGVIGISRERINLTLGTSMDGLWHRSRSVAGSADYQKYAADVMQVYDANVYQRDPVTGNIDITLNEDNSLNFTLLHAKDDPVLDGEGQPVVLHRAGDTVLDSNGQPIVVSTGSLERQVDLLMVEGVYFFVTETDAAAYAKAIAATLVTWLTQDLASMAVKLLEKTSLYLYPKSTVGDLVVLVKEGQSVIVPAAQTFNVRFDLNRTAWRDETNRAPLTAAAITALSNGLKNKTVAMKDISAALALSVGSDVVGFEVDGLGGDLNLATMTVIDDSKRLAIRKLAVIEADGTIGVTDGVGVTFTLHDTTTSLSSVS